MRLAALPTGWLSGDQKADLLGNRDRMVGEALVVAADQGGVHRWVHAM